jgi:hypothetical protein
MRHAFGQSIGTRCEFLYSVCLRYEFSLDLETLNSYRTLLTQFNLVFDNYLRQHDHSPFAFSLITANGVKNRHIFFDLGQKEWALSYKIGPFLK